MTGARLILIIAQDRSDVYTNLEVIRLTATIQKWGNSHGIRLPQIILDGLNLKEGSEVEITPQNNGILIKSIHMKRPKIQELFEGYNGDYQPEEIDWGEPVGGEIW
jgi:antitoxin MazE